VSSQYLRFSARGALARARSPLLERLIARADESTAVIDWRADAFRLIAPQAEKVPSVGAAALFAATGPVAGAWVYLATPVHYVAEMSNVRLAPDGILALRQTEAENLALDFNRVWHDAGARFVAGSSAELFCVFDRPLPATTHDPEEMLDRHIEEYLPSGADAPRLRHLMSEIELWLFDHSVNRARRENGLLPVNGLWLWGGGPALTSMPRVLGFGAGADPLFKWFARPASQPGAGARGRAGAAAEADTGSRAGANSAVIVVAETPGTPAWAEVESRWLTPALEQLKSRRLARLDLSAGNRCYLVSARGSRRFWRRTRPWWEAFE
jgi:hypothetical protein